MLKYDELYSNFAFNVNLRRYPTDILRAVAAPSASNIGWRFQARPY
jgi:hypothetical protein